MKRTFVLGATTLAVVCALPRFALCQEEAVNWAPTWGASASGGTLVKVGPDGWDSGGFSSKSLMAGSGYVDFGVTDAATDKACGLARHVGASGLDDIDFAIRLTADGNVTSNTPDRNHNGRAFSLWMAAVIEQLVMAPGDLGKFVHHVLYYGRGGSVV